MSSNVLTYIIEVQDKVFDKLKTIQKGVLRQPLNGDVLIGDVIYTTADMGASAICI